MQVEVVAGQVGGHLVEQREPAQRHLLVILKHADHHSYSMLNNPFVMARVVPHMLVLVMKVHHHLLHHLIALHLQQLKAINIIGFLNEVVECPEAVIYQLHSLTSSQQEQPLEHPLFCHPLALQVGAYCHVTEYLGAGQQSVFRRVFFQQRQKHSKGRRGLQEFYVLLQTIHLVIVAQVPADPVQTLLFLLGLIHQHLHQVLQRMALFLREGLFIRQCRLFKQKPFSALSYQFPSFGFPYTYLEVFSPEMSFLLHEVHRSLLYKGRLHKHCLSTVLTLQQAYMKIVQVLSLALAACSGLKSKMSSESSLEQELAAYKQFRAQYLPEQDDYITPINTAARSQIGGMVPNGFGPSRMQDFNYNNPRRAFSSDCPCAEKMPKDCPPCNPDNKDKYSHYQYQLQMMQCDCAPRPNCPPCSTMFSALAINQDSQNRQEVSQSDQLKHSAEQQAQLYDEITHLDEQANEEQKKAIEASRLMTEANNNAEQLKAQMQKLKARARELAEQTLLTLNPSTQDGIQSTPTYLNDSPYNNPPNVNPRTSPVTPI